MKELIDILAKYTEQFHTEDDFGIADLSWYPEARLYGDGSVEFMDVNGMPVSFLSYTTLITTLQRCLDTNTRMTELPDFSV